VDTTCRHCALASQATDEAFGTRLIWGTGRRLASVSAPVWGNEWMRSLSDEEIANEIPGLDDKELLHIWINASDPNNPFPFEQAARDEIERRQGLGIFSVRES
jgi:hypothetical protein